MNIEDQGIGEGADIVETPFRNACFPQGNDDARDQDESDRRGCNCAGLVADGKLRGAVPDRIIARDDGNMFEVPADIFLKISHRPIASRRILAEGHQNNVVDIPGQLFA